MPWKHAVSVQVHWWEDNKAPGNVNEAVVEVQFPNQQRKFLTVQILRVSDNFVMPAELNENSEYRKIAENAAPPEDKVKANLNPPGVTERPPGFRG